MGTPPQPGRRRPDHEERHDEQRGTSVEPMGEQQRNHTADAGDQQTLEQLLWRTRALIEITAKSLRVVVSKTISEELLQEHDCVITMEVQQRDFLKFSFPEFGNRIHTLTELAMDLEMDIDDPIKLEYIVYEKTFKMIEDYTIKVFEKLIKRYKLGCQ